MTTRYFQVQGQKSSTLDCLNKALCQSTFHFKEALLTQAIFNNVDSKLIQRAWAEDELTLDTTLILLGKLGYTLNLIPQ